MDYRIYPPDGMPEATVSLPRSKSISNRALIMNALAGAPAGLDDVADCDDTKAIISALSGDNKEINVGAAGTAMRFLTAYFAAKIGSDVTIDGSERMRHRPIGPLVNALRSLGASITYMGEEGFPPLRIKGWKLSGGELSIPATVSSQFISALLMVAPAFDAPLRLVTEGEIASFPYIKMTIEMMRRRGISVEREGNAITVNPGNYRSVAEEIEPDWSAASYWYEIAAISTGWISLPGLREDSIQGDRAAADYFERIGVITSFEDGKAELSASPELYSRLDLDMQGQPDLVQSIAVVSCMLGVPFRFTGVSSLRIKETDRLEALRLELDKLGFLIEIEGDDVIAWEGRRHPLLEFPQIDTYDDHRMAMAFAPVSIFVPGIVIRNAEVVSKSYPRYWQDLSDAGFRIEDAEEPSEATEAEDDDR